GPSGLAMTMNIPAIRRSPRLGSDLLHEPYPRIGQVPLMRSKQMPVKEMPCEAQSFSYIRERCFARLCAHKEGWQPKEPILVRLARPAAHCAAAFGRDIEEVVPGARSRTACEVQPEAKLL